MKKEVVYYHYGPQCYGYRHMGEQAEKAAKILNYEYREVDIAKEQIVVDDLNITYPGTPEQLIESIKLNGPLTGEHKYIELPDSKPGFTGGEFGYIAFVDSKAVAAVEFMCEKRIPYAITAKREQFLFITCIYNNPSADKDYRSALINRLKNYAVNNGFKGISIICGYETPYPNGPVKKLLENKFIIKSDLGKVMLRYKWEQICFMEWAYNGE